MNLTLQQLHDQTKFLLEHSTAMPSTETNISEIKTTLDDFSRRRVIATLGVESLVERDLREHIKYLEDQIETLEQQISGL